MKKMRNNKTYIFLTIYFNLVFIISSILFSMQGYAETSIKDLLSGRSTQSAHPSVDDAFSLIASVKDEHQIEILISAIPNTYTYQNSYRFSSDNSSVQLLTPQFPQAKTIVDEHYGKTQVFSDNNTIIVPYQSDQKNNFTFTVEFQGCLKDVLCYPPTSRTFELTAFASSERLEGIPKAVDLKTEIKSISEQSLAEDLLKNSTFLVVIGGFFLLGLLLSLTPCLLPMLPIISGIIAGHKHNITKKHAFLLSLTYVTSMALTFMIAGILVAAAGINLVSSLQNPPVILAMCAIFIFLAIASFGYIELKVPDVITQKLSNAQQHQKGGTFLGVALMGVFSALIISPCATAPFAGALVYISTTGDILLGGASLFVLGFGMGIPVLLFGTSAGHLLPKAGPWMKEVNIFFGVVFIGIAIYLLTSLIPGPMVLVLSAFLLIFYAVHLGLLEPAAHGWQRAQKGCALVMAIYGSFLLAGATQNQSDILHPFGKIYSQQTTQDANYTNLEFTKISNIKDFNHQLEQAKANNQRTIVEFYADYCSSCRAIERNVLPTPKIYSILKDYKRLKVDITYSSKDDKKLMQKLKVFNPPTFIFYDTNGMEIKDSRVVGKINADTLYKLLTIIEEA